jgi:ABC-type amino acid transport substrate-binding protein
MPSDTDAHIKLEFDVAVDTYKLAKAIRRLARDKQGYTLPIGERPRLKQFAIALAADLFIEDEEVAEDFARWFAEAHADQPRF